MWPNDRILKLFGIELPIIQATHGYLCFPPKWFCSGFRKPEG